MGIVAERHRADVIMYICVRTSIRSVSTHVRFCVHSKAPLIKANEAQLHDADVPRTDASLTGPRASVLRDLLLAHCVIEPLFYFVARSMPE